MQRLIIILLMAIIGALAAASAVTAANDCGCCCDKPYGSYRASSRWGWYGARQNISSVEEARQYLTEFYASSNIRIGTITDHDGYYEAEIFRKANAKQDRVIIDKGCGRIRSIE